MSESCKQQGAFGWSELLTDDIQAAKDFYQQVIGWEVEEMETMTYYVVKAAGNPAGGMMAKQPG